MDGAELMRKLLSGSDEINRMQREIKSIVGILDSKIGALDGYNDLATSGEYRWFVAGSRVQDVSGICCTKNDKTLLFSDCDKPVHIPMHEVQNVHATLPALLEGAFRVYPNLAKDLKPLLDAGK